MLFCLIRHSFPNQSINQCDQLKSQRVDQKPTAGYSLTHTRARVGFWGILMSLESELSAKLVFLPLVFTCLLTGEIKLVSAVSEIINPKMGETNNDFHQAAATLMW